MPKRRPMTGQYLPERVYLKHGSYFYVNFQNKWINLGRNYPKAMAKWAEIIDRPPAIFSMNQLFDRYMLEIAPQKAGTTYKQNQIQMNYLRTFFGEMKPSDVTPVDVYAYLDVRKKQAKVAPNREKALLSHVFSLAIRWGVVTQNPCRDVKRIPEQKRDRYVRDDEFAAVKNIAPEIVQHAMTLGYITALRRGDLLKISLDNLTEEGIELTIGKTKIKSLILWSDELKRCVEVIKNFALERRGHTLLCTRKGKMYSTHGFDAIWKRVIKKAVDEKLIQERFRFHDIRRKAATDAERRAGREFARQLLGHQEQSTTAIYISGRERIEPLL